jgi:hypothetical protein
MVAASLEDRLEIVDLTVAYCWALDTRSWSDLDEVFLPDASAELAAPLLQGRDKIKARIRGALEPLDDSQHMVTNHQVAVDSDTATSRCYFHAQHVRRGLEGGENLIIAGRYEDDLKRTSAGWRISHRQLVVMWREGNPAVVNPPRG